SAETGYVPQNTVAVEDKGAAEKLLKLIDSLEDNDDVQDFLLDFADSGDVGNDTGIPTKTIQDNEKDLGVDRREAIKQATAQFTSTLRSTAGSLLTSTSLTDAGDTLQAASADLATAYRAALEPVDCSGVDVNN
ncbi:MAG: YebC/PmpR family DNA-binding transcriptional regulator, partial [Solirubrobacterales bacterium]